MKTSGKTSGVTRRGFIKTAAAVSAALATSGWVGRAAAAGSDTIRVGLVGCGGRGLYDTTMCLNSTPGVELVAMGDLFKDRLDSCLEELRKAFGPEAANRIKVTPETSFVGFDAIQKVVQLPNVDLVILTTPPHFRPEHLRAAVTAGKHAFVEKPVAVDPVGVRSVIESADLADQKNLTIVAGTQARRMVHRVELMKRLRDGALGDITGGVCIRMGDAMRGWGPAERLPQWSDMEWQIRNWLFHTWLSGDFVDEMHVHELDVMNWMVGATPEVVTALGGRQARTGDKFGDVYDHFSAELLYPNEVRVSYLGAQIDGTDRSGNERLTGTKGNAYSGWDTSWIKGANPYQWEGQLPEPCLMQHADQIAAIREGKKLNEGRRIAESTLTALMVRMSAYTGRSIQWKWALNSSKLDLSPQKYELGALPKPEVATPGLTQLI